MLSIGIQFGEGFDKPSILKLLQMPPEEWDYDLLVLGTSPGGIACAREASLAGKRAAVVKWRKNVQMEEEIYEAELSETAQALEDDFSELSQTRITKRLKSSVPTILNSSKVHIGILKSSSKKSLRNDLWWQKVRANKLDLVNELFKRGKLVVMKKLIRQNKIRISNQKINNRHKLFQAI